MRSLVVTLCIISLIGNILPMFRHSFWWLRIFDFPKVHIAFLSIISIILQLLYFGVDHLPTTLCSVVIFISIVYNAPKIIKYTRFGKITAKKAESDLKNCLRIIHSNVRMENQRTDEVIQLVQKYQPDIVVLVETNQWWINELSKLELVYPYRVKIPLDNTYGMMLLSKLELLQSEVKYLVKNDIPSIFAVIRVNGQVFNLFCLHPEPPKPGTDTYERDAEILIVGQKIKNDDKACIVVGDLNDVAWSHTSELFQKYSNLLDPREGRGFFNTYNAKIGIFRYPLDHIFYSRHFGLKQIKRLEPIGSDHFPILIDVCLNLEDNQINETESDRNVSEKEVNEKIADAEKAND